MTAEKSTKERSKVVLRHIPPGFTAESLLHLLKSNLSPFPQYDFFHFSPADYSLYPYLFCRAYFNFLEPESIISFKEKFDGQTFEDCNKVVSAGIVEYAPFQRIPKRSKKDVRSGTIDKDADYLEFLKEREAEPEAPPSIETIINEIEKQRAARIEEQSSTALLDFIKNRRSERSLSPSSKSHYTRRPAKLDDHDTRKFKHDRRPPVRSGSETDPVEPNSEEVRSRNNVKSERQARTGESKAKPDKALYVPGKRKPDDSSKNVSSFQDGFQLEVDLDSKLNLKEERHSYRRDKVDTNTNDKKVKDSQESAHDQAKNEWDSKKEGETVFRKEQEYRRNDHNDQDRKNRDRIRDDAREYRRDGFNDSRNRRDKEFRHGSYDDQKDYDQDNEYYGRRGGHGRGSYRGGHSRGGGWREDRRGGRGSRGRGRGSYRGDRSDR